MGKLVSSGSVDSASEAVGRLGQAAVDLSTRGLGRSVRLDVPVSKRGAPSRKAKGKPQTALTFHVDLGSADGELNAYFWDTGWYDLVLQPMHPHRSLPYGEAILVHFDDWARGLRL